MRAPALGVPAVGPRHGGARGREQPARTVCRPRRVPVVRAQAANGNGNGVNGKGSNCSSSSGVGEASKASKTTKPVVAGNAAPSSSSSSPQQRVEPSDEVLRLVHLLEKREQERSDDNKNLLTLIKSLCTGGVAGTAATTAAVTDLQRLERAYAQDGLASVNSAANNVNTINTECLMQHPGVLCCTKTSIAVDEATKQVVLTLRTQVNPSGSGDAQAAVGLSEQVALGAQALCIAANDLSCDRTAAASALSADATATHAELVAILQNGVVVDSAPMEGGIHPSFKVLLEHRGKRSWALFKPRIDGDGDGWHRATMEWVAYELNLMLGLDLVPPVAYRRGGVDCHYQHFEEGAFIHFVPDAMELREAPQEEWGVSRSVLLSDTRILDVLLHNSDRHHGHFLFGPSWVAPNGGKAAKQPILIDHAAAFRKEAHVTLDHENAFRTGPVRCVSARTYLRLRFLDARAIAARFAGTLSTGEMRALLTRRNAVLERLDALVEVQGFANTVIENQPQQGARSGR